MTTDAPNVEAFGRAMWSVVLLHALALVLYTLGSEGTWEAAVVAAGATLVAAVVIGFFAWAD